MRRVTTGIMRLKCFVAAMVALPATATARAAFLTSFANITQGEPLKLEWDALDAKYYPLAISARFINRTEQNRANGVLVNLTGSLASGTSWTWASVPYPLPYVNSAIYEVLVRPAVWSGREAGDESGGAETGGLGAPVLVKSKYFAVNDAEGPAPRKPGELIPGDGSTAKSGPSNRTLALGIGVSIGVASAIAFVIILFVLRKRRRRVLEEKKRRRREFVIN